MNLSPFPNKAPCGCRKYEPMWLIFLRSFFFLSLFFSFLGCGLYYTYKFILFLVSHSSVAIVMGGLGIFLVSSLIGWGVTVSEQEERERERGHCANPNHK